MKSIEHKLWLLSVVVLFAFAWRGSHADPFIPVGTINTGSDGDEAGLASQRSGLVFKQTSLMYIYVVQPNETNSNNTITKKAIFFPPIDKLSKLTIPGTFNSYVTNKTSPDNLYLFASAFGLNSTNKGYLFREGGFGGYTYVVGSFSLVVEMERGVPKKLTWIDGCGECAKDTPQAGESVFNPPAHCVTDNCAVPSQDCTDANVPCDIKIYLAWVGTDARGRPSTSSGSLPFNFLQFGLTPAYRAAAGITKQYLFNLGNWGTKLPWS